MGIGAELRLGRHPGTDHTRRLAAFPQYPPDGCRAALALDDDANVDRRADVGHAVLLRQTAERVGHDTVGPRVTLKPRPVADTERLEGNQRGWDIV